MYVTDFSTRTMVFRSNAARYGKVSRPSQARPAAGSATVASEFASRISELKEEFAALRDLVTEAKLGSSRSKAGFTRSVDAVTGISAEASQASLRSSEQVNTTPTSLSDRAPAVQKWTLLSGWQPGGSSAQAVLTGTYTGSTDGRYQIKMINNVNLNGIKGRLNFRVYKNDVEVASHTIDNPDYDNGTELSIGDGLSVSFDGGQVRGGESYFFDASASVGTDLDPTKAFNGTGADDPGLSPDTPIVDGSVEINGVEVQVNASDSLDDFMARVNSAGAGVQASFDTASDTITFTATDTGEQDITFANDSSGIVAALKLDTAVVTPGQAADRTRVLDEVGGLAGVSSGTLTINGVDIEIDTSVDSLDDVLGRINSSAAGVRATYSDTTGRLSISNTSASADLVLDHDSSGLLSRLNVETGTYASTKRRGISADKAEALTEAMTRVVTELNDLYAQLRGSDTVAAIGTTQNNLRRDLRTFVGASGRTQLGMRFDYSGDGPLVDFDAAAQRRFRSALSSNGAGVEGFLEGKGTRDGFLDILEQQLGAAESALASTYGTGILVSRAA